MSGRTTFATCFDHEKWAAKRGIIDDGKPGRGGRVKVYSAEELARFAAERGTTVSRNKWPSSPKSTVWQLGKRRTKQGK